MGPPGTIKLLRIESASLLRIDFSTSNAHNVSMSRVVDRVLPPVQAIHRCIKSL